MPATQTTTLRHAEFFKRLPMLLVITLIGQPTRVLWVYAGIALLESAQIGPRSDILLSGEAS